MALKRDPYNVSGVKESPLAAKIDSESPRGSEQARAAVSADVDEMESPSSTFKVVTNAAGMMQDKGGGTRVEPNPRAAAGSAHSIGASTGSVHVGPDKRLGSAPEEHGR